MQRREFLESLLAASLAFVPTTQRKARVVIIGAGLSGMVAALELRNNGFEVTILEASQRPGGRVHTLREPFSDGIYVRSRV
jgi:monoamine oxidase